MTDVLLYEKQDHIARITLNRPEKRNAIDPEMMVKLGEAWIDFEKDDDLRVAIVTGAGDKSFCAGADLARLIPLMTGARQPEDEWDDRLRSEPNLARAALLRDFPLYKPVRSTAIVWQPARSLSKVRTFGSPRRTPRLG